MGPTTRRLAACGVAAAVAFGLALTFAPPAHADSNVDEAQFFADLNAVRARNGVPPLATDGQLITVARAWSAQMACCAGLAHNPNLASQVSNWKTLGENVGTGGDVASVEAALEASPHHFQNMVDPAFQYVGIGVVEQADGTIWVTEDFKQAKTGTLPATQVPQPAPKPTPPPAPRPPAPAPSGAHTPAVSHTATAGAGAPSANATLASATAPAPDTSPPSAPEPARSHKTLHTGLLAIVSHGPTMDGPQVASLSLFSVLGGATFLAGKGRLPALARLRR